jgi:hypothetical protein
VFLLGREVVVGCRDVLAGALQFSFAVTLPLPLRTLALALVIATTVIRRLTGRPLLQWIWSEQMLVVRRLYVRKELKEICDARLANSVGIFHRVRRVLRRSSVVEKPNKDVSGVSKTIESPSSVRSAV